MPIDMPPVSAHETQLRPPIELRIAPPNTAGRSVVSNITATKLVPRGTATIYVGLYIRRQGAIVGSTAATRTLTISRTRTTTRATISAGNPCRPGVRSFRAWATANAVVKDARGRTIGNGWTASTAVITFQCRR